MRSAAALAIALASGSANGGGGPSLSGDLPAKLLHLRGDFDVFTPKGVHQEVTVKVAAPLGLGTQVPLRILVHSSPENQATQWKVDPDGRLFVELKDQTGESRLSLVIDVDLLVMQSVNNDDAQKSATIVKRSASSALKPYLRPLFGADPRDPEVAKLAASAKVGELRAGLKTLHDIVAQRVKDGTTGTDDAGDALRTGRGSELSRANLFAALTLASGVPTREICCVSARRPGEIYYLNEIHAGALGWLRYDTLERGGAPFPWSELEDVVLFEVNADVSAKGGMRPRWCECRGGLTAGPKSDSAWSCSEKLATTISRACSKEVAPVLEQAFADVRSDWRKAAEPLDLLATDRASRCKPLVEWSAPIKAALDEKEGAPSKGSPRGPP